MAIEELFGAPRYGSLPDEVRDAVSREWEGVSALHPADPEAAEARAWIEVIPAPLLERLELVRLEEYAEDEKLRIAAEHLLPRQRGRHGLAPADLSLSDEALRDLVRGYTREPGVWALDRRIGALCRRAARRIKSMPTFAAAAEAAAPRCAPAGAIPSTARTGCRA